MYKRQLHGFGLAVTRFFQRQRDDRPDLVMTVFGACAGIAAGGFVLLSILPPEFGTWARLVILWLTVTPMWAVTTAWLGETPAKREAEAPRELQLFGLPEYLRWAMCAAMLLALAVLRYLPADYWIPAVLLPWGLAIGADIAEANPIDPIGDFVRIGRRAVSVILTFQYVCLAWIFFRATSFDNALAILRQIARGEMDRANLVPLLTTAMVVAFAAHFFADGSFRWLRERFVRLPWYGQGVVLAGAGMIMRELAHTKIVPFIYFQF